MVKLFPKLLQEGDEGPDVKWLQQLLYAVGMAHPQMIADGRFGPCTKDSLIRLQTAILIDRTGQLDEDTLTILRSRALYLDLSKIPV